VPANVLRVAVGIGALVDVTVAMLALFFQPLLGPLLDVPTKDPALTTIAGGEYLVATGIYLLLLRDLDRYRGLLWLIALDQLLAALLPGIEIARGHVVASVKTLGPIPFNLLLAGVYLVGAVRPSALPLGRRLG
jgi:hypothetical protein